MNRIFISILIIFLCLKISACSMFVPKQFNVIFYNASCIKPFRNYEYLTCHPIYVTINKSIVVVPAGFHTDLASIPRWLWTIVASSNSAFFSASILHDYLYTCHNGYDRKEADSILYKALTDNGVSRFDAYQAYIAVRIFGSKHYSESNCFILNADQARYEGCLIEKEA